MADWPIILKDCAENMKREVRPLFGSAEAQKGFGRGAGGDIKKKIDLVSENALIRTLQEHCVSCTLVSEEAGIREIGSSPSHFFVTVDPVDGTTNAIRGLPFFDISIAVSRKPVLSNVTYALVVDVLRDITYTAWKSGGAHKNGKRIEPSETATLEEAVVGVDFSNFKASQVVNSLTRVLEKTRHLRHLGANALEICYVADGTTDAFIDIRGRLRITDFAAAYLILLEAGGIVTAPGGSKLNASLDPKQRVSFVAAANKRIHDTILNMIETERADC